MSSNISGASVTAGSGGGGGEGDPPPPQPSVHDEDNRPMTFDEKHRLSMLVNRLPGPELGRLISLIVSRHPTMNSDGNEFVLDFEELEPATLRAIEKFLFNIFGDL